jgi:enoyl-CoA hydratase
MNTAHTEKRSGAAPVPLGVCEDLQYLKLEKPAELVWLITLNHHDKRNALSVALLAELARVLAAAEVSDDVRAVVLTGGERFFSAGADIADMAARGVAAYADPVRLASWKAIEMFPKPLIAAVNGFAIGGGHELVMLADIVVAADDAAFSQREIVIGALPGDGATQRLPRVLGKTLAMKLVLTGEPLTAAEAERHGLVTEVVTPARSIARAIEIASLIAARAPLAVRLAKRAVLDSFETSLQGGLEREHQVNLDVFKTEDRAEGHRAFVEKRPPHFKGR